MAVFAGMLIPAANSGFVENTQVYEDSESLTVDYSNPSTLTNQYALAYLDNETILHNGNTLAEGTDYEFNTSSGSVTWYNSTNTSAGDEARIGYEYEAHPEGSRESANVLTGLAPIMGVLLLFVGIGVMFYISVGKGGGF